MAAMSGAILLPPGVAAGSGGAAFCVAAGAFAASRGRDVLRRASRHPPARGRRADSEPSPLPVPSRVRRLSARRGRVAAFCGFAVRRGLLGRFLRAQFLLHPLDHRGQLDDALAQHLRLGFDRVRALLPRPFPIRFGGERA